jgi:hypothetical protein
MVSLERVWSKVDEDVDGRVHYVVVMTDGNILEPSSACSPANLKRVTGFRD